MPVFKQKSKSVNISFDFIDKFFPTANPAFIMVYIYALRLSVENIAMDYAELSSKLGLLESDIVKALRYWSDNNLIILDEDLVIFNNLQNISEENLCRLNKTQYVSSSKKYTMKNKASKENHMDNADSEADIEVEFRKPTKAEKNKEILNSVEQNEMLADMFEKVQEFFGKPLSTAEIQTLYSISEILPPAVIVLLAEYCVSKSKDDMNYIEKTAVSWNDRGINTVEKALEFLETEKSKNMLMTEFKKMFQIYGRNFTEPEENIIMTWINDYHISVELIKLAYETTMLNIGRFSLKYMNGIIMKWNDKGISDVETAKSEQKRFFEKSQKSGQNYSASESYKDYNVFTNDNYDYNAIENMSRKK